MYSKIITAGKSLDDAQKVLILIHGRGGNANDILSITNHLDVENFAFIAPEAEGNTWYPYSFLAPGNQNEPHLSSAIALLKKILDDLFSKGITSENIYFLGFSQGACLASEFIAREARRFGGAAIFTGGLIGEKINQDKYKGDFNNTPVFIGTGDPDPHVPVERVEATVKILEGMNARVKVRIYKNRPHTISQDEIEEANNFVFKQ